MTKVIGRLVSALGLLAVFCSVGAGDQATASRTLKVGGGARTYLLHTPAALTKERPAPLVLVFHGGGGTASGTERMTRFSPLAAREGFIVAYPEGIGRGWNDGRSTTGVRAQRENVDDVAFVAAMIDSIARDHPVDPKRIYATGISNGAIFSHYLAARLSRRIAAIAPVVGGMADPFHQQFRPEKPVSVLILQGTKDPLVPYHGGPIAFSGRGSIIDTDETVRLWIEHNGTAREPATEDVPDQVPGDSCTGKRMVYGGGRDGTEVVLYRLEGAGHTWPGGTQYLPERTIGKVCRDLDATAVIWEFFKRHSKP